ncbi:dioxygenase family protein [Laceyella tengchongensis]
MLPALFLAHGSPMLAIEQTDYTQFLERLGQTLKPKAIVIFSAHWESEVQSISFTDGVYETIHDFYGFPEELYALRYPAKGSVQLAERLAEMFTDGGIEVRKDRSRGLDHGSWTLLHRMYPQADIPVIQLSVNPFLPPETQFNIGACLRGIGAEGILIIGSGVTVHNLRALKWEQTTPEPWAVAFDDWLVEKVRTKDWDNLFRYAKLAPYADMAVPTPEHFVPLFIAMGSGSPQAEAKVLHRSYDLGTLSYLCLQF